MPAICCSIAEVAYLCSTPNPENMMSKITLALLDDHNLARKGFISLLKDFDDIEVIIEEAGCTEFFEQLTQRQSDVILMNIELHEIHGYQVVDNLKEKFPDIKIIVLMMHKDESHVVNLIEKGVNGFLHRDASVDALTSSIREVSKNNYYFDKNISTSLAKKIIGGKKHPLAQHNEQLTDKELQIIMLICKENSNKEIAEKMFLSPRTIDTYRERIMQKIGAKNTAGVVIYAMKHDLLGTGMNWHL